MGLPSEFAAIPHEVQHQVPGEIQAFPYFGSAYSFFFQNSIPSYKNRVDPDKLASQVHLGGCTQFLTKSLPVNTYLK